MCLVRVHRTSTKTDFPILSTSTPTTPVRCRCHTHNYLRSQDWGYSRRTQKILHTTQRRMLRLITQKENTNARWKLEEETRDDEISEETQGETSTNDDCDAAFHSTTTKKAQQVKKKILKTGLNTPKEAREKLLKNC